MVDGGMVKGIQEEKAILVRYNYDRMGAGGADT